MFHVKTKICLFVRSQMAEIGPPLGTVLGNMGVNATKFVKDFNDFTKDLPVYFLLKVYIYILEDRSCTFSIFLPTTGYILSTVKLIKNVTKLKKQNYVSLKNVVQLCLLKFPMLPLQKSLPIILGSVNSSKIFIVY